MRALICIFIILYTTSVYARPPEPMEFKDLARVTNCKDILLEDCKPGYLRKHVEGNTGYATSVHTFNATSERRGFSFRRGHNGYLSVSIKHGSSYKYQFTSYDSRIKCWQSGRVNQYCGGSHGDQNVSIVINHQGYIEERINNVAKWRSPNPMDTTENYYIYMELSALDLKIDNINWIYSPKNDNDIGERLDVELHYNYIDYYNSKFSMPKTGQLAKIRGGDGWNADATSILVITNISSVMGVQFIPNNTKHVAVGLVNSNPSFAFNTMDYAIYVDGSNSYRIYEKNNRRLIGYYNYDDVFSIVINEDGIIEYRINNAVQYTSNVSIDLPLFVDISMHNQGEILKNISFVPSTYAIPAPPSSPVAPPAPPLAPGVPAPPPASGVPAPPSAPGVPAPPSAPAPPGSVWLSKLSCIKEYNTNISVTNWVVKVARNTTGCPTDIRFTVEVVPNTATSGIHHSTTGDMSVQLNSQVLLQTSGDIQIRVLVRVFFGNINYLTSGKTFIYSETTGSFQVVNVNGGTSINIMAIVEEQGVEYILLPSNTPLITCPDRECTTTNTPITLGNNIYVSVYHDNKIPVGHQLGQIITIRFEGKEVDIVQQGNDNGNLWALTIAEEVCDQCAINVTSTIVPITTNRRLLSANTTSNQPMVLVSSNIVTVNDKFPMLIVSVSCSAFVVLVVAGVAVFRYRRIGKLRNAATVV